MPQERRRALREKLQELIPHRPARPERPERPERAGRADRMQRQWMIRLDQNTVEEILAVLEEDDLEVKHLNTLASGLEATRLRNENAELRQRLNAVLTGAVKIELEELIESKMKQKRDDMAVAAEDINRRDQAAERREEAVKHREDAVTKREQALANRP